MLVVRDDGMGISAEMLPKIFDMYSRANLPGRTASDGLGIGLALVKGLVELHHGTVEARSAGEGCGSEFIVTCCRSRVGAGDDVNWRALSTLRLQSLLSCARRRPVGPVLLQAVDECLRLVGVQPLAERQRLVLQFLSAPFDELGAPRPESACSRSTARSCSSPR